MVRLTRFISLTSRVENSIYLEIESRDIAHLRFVAQFGISQPGRTQTMMNGKVVCQMEASGRKQKTSGSRLQYLEMGEDRWLLRVGGSGGRGFIPASAVS